MPLNVQLVNAQVKDPQSGQMTPAGLIGSDAISTINTAKNQAVAAIEQKGEETKESIPDDYTALTDEVGELKTQLSDISENVKTENIVDEENLLNITGATVEDGFYKFSTSQAYNTYSNTTFPHDEFKENTRYTLSGIFKQGGDDSTKNGLFIQLKYTDNTSSELKIPLNIESGTQYSITSTAGKTLDKINFSYGHAVDCYIKDLMMVEGITVPQSYIPYNILTAKDTVAREELNELKNDYESTVIDIVEIDTANLVNQEDLLNITDAVYEDGFYKFSTYQAHNAYSTASFPHDEFKPNTRYTLSAIFKQEGDDSTKNGLFIQLKYTDNTSSELKIPLNIQNGTMFSIISSAGKTLDKINFSYGNVAYCYIKDLMMVEGTNVPDVFIPYHIITAKDILARNTINTVLETTNPQKCSINKNIKSINHRGYYGFPENTIPAFIESKKRGFGIVETDVRTTSDGVLVLLHDESINRTARNIDGSSIENTVNISNITYAQALEYDFGIYAGAEYAGTKIPTLTEFLTLCHRIGLDCYIEIKAAQAQNIVDTVKRTSMADRCTFISSSTSALSGITALLPKNRLGVVLTEINASNIAAIHLLETADNTVFADLLYSAGTISSSITMLYQEDIPLEVWTVNDSYVIYNMDPYITGITSDNKIGGYESFIGNLADIT